MRQLPTLQPARGRWCVIAGWLAAMLVSSAMFVAATSSDGAQSHGCGWASSYLGEWKMALPPVLLALMAMSVGITWWVCRCGAEDWWKSHRKDVAPLLPIALLVYAFAAAYAAGWWGVCDMPSPSVAALASAGAALSGVMFGVYCGVCGLPRKWPFQNAPMIVLAAAVAIAAFAYFTLQVAVGRELLGEVVRLLLVTFAMTAMVATVGIFVAKYGKSPEQNWRRCWCVLVLFAVLIGLGAIFDYIPSDADDCRVGHSANVQPCAAQALWAGVMVLAALLAAIMAAAVAEHVIKLPTWPDRLVLALVLAGMTVRLALSAGDYSHIQSEYGTLPPGISVATLLGIWHVFATMIAAMLGATVAVRMRAELDDAQPRPGTGRTM